MSETVFILGAGASKKAGAPLMNEFLDVAEDLLRSGKADEYKEDFERVFKAISKLQSVHSKATLDIINIESVFAAFEMGKLLKRLPSMTSDDIDSLLISIRRLIYKTLEETVKFPCSGNKKRIHPDPTYEIFAKLIQELNKLGAEKRCSVITFNYDIALDYALDHAHIPADYCLEETIEHRRTPLMKLHGSLNWARCKKCKKIIPWDIQSYFNKVQINFPLQNNYICLPFASMLPSGLEHCGEKVESEPVIVPPTWNKAEHHEGISSVWRHAAQELSEARNIFVLGYSLPDSDYFFRNLFALGTVGESRIRRFEVFNPDESVKTKFKNLIGQGVEERFKFFYNVPSDPSNPHSTIVKAYFENAVTNINHKIPN